MDTNQVLYCVAKLTMLFRVFVEADPLYHLGYQGQNFPGDVKVVTPKYLPEVSKYTIPFGEHQMVW